MKYLLDRGLLDGSCLTCTGQTIAENLRDLPGLTPGQAIVAPLEKPLKPNGHISILHGNLAPQGAVGKINGKQGLTATGPARCHDRQEEKLGGPKHSTTQNG